MIPIALVHRLVEAALDQPRPTGELVTVLNLALIADQHPDRLRLEKAA